MGFFLGVWSIVTMLGEEEVVVVLESDTVLESTSESHSPQRSSIFFASSALYGGVTPRAISCKLCVTCSSLMCSVGIGQKKIVKRIKGIGASGHSATTKSILVGCEQHIWDDGEYPATTAIRVG